MHAFWQSGVHELKLLAEKIDRSKGAISEKIKRSARVLLFLRRKTTTSVSLKEPLLMCIRMQRQLFYWLTKF